MDESMLSHDEIDRHPWKNAEIPGTDILSAISQRPAVIMPESGFSSAAKDDRKHIVLKRANPTGDNAPFSDAVLVGDTLYIAGHLGLDPATGKPGATPEAEARFLLEAFKSTIESAGMSLEDLVSVQIYCSDTSLYDTFNSVYQAYIRSPFPARAFLGMGTLLLNARFQIQGIAVKRKL